jgi:hypothetical protein
MSSKRLQTAKRWVDHYATLDPDILESILDENFTLEHAPALVKDPVPLGKQVLKSFVADLSVILQGYPMTVKLTTESESSNSVTIWIHGTTKFREEVKDDGVPSEDWNCTGEYMLVLYMNDKGDKIVKAIEFVDTKTTLDKLYGLIRRSRENLKKK